MSYKDQQPPLPPAEPSGTEAVSSPPPRELAGTAQPGPGRDHRGRRWGRDWACWPLVTFLCEISLTHMTNLKMLLNFFLNTVKCRLAFLKSKVNTCNEILLVLNEEDSRAPLTPWGSLEAILLSD